MLRERVNNMTSDPMSLILRARKLFLKLAMSPRV